MSECCCICVDDYATVAYDEIRTARKEHRCCECGAKILPKQKYERTGTLFEGQWTTYKTCIPCVGIRRDFFTCGWYYGQMRNDFRECNGWDYVTGEGEFDDEEDHR